MPGWVLVLSATAIGGCWTPPLVISSSFSLTACAKSLKVATGKFLAPQLGLAGGQPAIWLSNVLSALGLMPIVQSSMPAFLAFVAAVVVDGPVVGRPSVERSITRRGTVFADKRLTHWLMAPPIFVNRRSVVFCTASRAASMAALFAEFTSVRGRKVCTLVLNPTIAKRIVDPASAAGSSTWLRAALNP